MPARLPTHPRPDPYPGLVTVPAPFAHALKSLKAARLPGYVQLTEIPGPRRLAPFTVAITAVIEDDDTNAELVKGSFIVLYDPQSQTGWEGSTFRIVIMIRSLLEADLASDELLGQVAWSWLSEAVADLQVNALAGVVSRVVSEPFGAQSDFAPEAYVELRASWSPTDHEIGDHMHAWGHALATVAGLPPLPAGVTAVGKLR